MNSTTIAGNLTRDPELKRTPNGAAVCTFGVAVNKRVKDESGQWKDAETSFFDVTAWNALAEGTAETLKKGDRVLVAGRLRASSWETAEGEKRSRTEIVADEIGLAIRFPRVSA